MDEDEAKAVVLSGGNIAIEGLAGTGKSTFVGALAKELADLGKTLT